VSQATSLWAQIRDDWQVHDRDWSRPGFRTLAVYRFGVWRMGVRSRWLRMPLSFLYHRAFRHCRNVYGIELPSTCTVGRGVRIEHQGGIVIHGATVIGDECIIRQNCTLGIRRLDRRDDAPVLARGVNVGAGAVILGRVTIGEGAAIGANAVVLTDVPAGALATGVPAVVRLRG
jgi:serine O-acetyltransferase